MARNERLRHQRQLRGWAREDLVEELNEIALQRGMRPLGLTPNMVQSWENRGVRPRSPYPRLLCLLFGTTTEELGLYEPPAHLSSSPDMKRRAFLRGLGLATGIASAEPLSEPWERLSSALAGGTRADRETVANLEKVTMGLERLESQVSPRALLRPVLGHLSTVSELLAGSLRFEIRSTLSSVAGETAGLAGWLMWDLDLPNSATNYFKAGLDAATEAHDEALGAYLVGSSACEPYYREKPAERLRQLDGRTWGFKLDNASPEIRGWLATVEAEAHALAGDERACLRALDRAEHGLAAPSGADVPSRPRHAFFDAAYLAGERGVCLSRLGRVHDAETVLTSALTSLDQAMLKTQPRLLGALAETHVQQGNIDEACRVGLQALSSASELRVEPNIEAVRQLAEQLEPWHTSRVVTEFREQLRLAS